MRSRGITPAHLAGESGYSRQHLLRLRFGHSWPSRTCIASLTIAARHLTRERITPEDLFDAHIIRAAWRDTHELQRDEERRS